MSTCPDADLYSAYVDGEVPSPWKEKLEAHSAVCPDCRKRVQRYQALHSLMKKEIAPVGQTFLDESWERLRVRAAAAACTSQVRRVKMPWSLNDQLTVRIPIPALAAMLLLALFIPATFLARPPRGSQQQSLQYTALTSQATKLQKISTSNAVYSPDLAPSTLISGTLAANKDNLFRMINLAQQFATEKNLFSDGEIIIIRLPSLTHFSNSGDFLEKTDEPLLQTASFLK